MATPDLKSPSDCRLLALETSGRTGSVALAELVSADKTVIVAAKQLPPVERSAKSLAPAIAELLASVGWKPTDLTAIAVTDGPGSFTGLRVGVTTAKTMAYALDAQVVGINPLAAMAQPEQVLSDKPGGRLWTLLDAQRQERFVALFDSEPSTNAEPVETLRLHESEFFARLQPGDIVISPLASAMFEEAKTTLSEGLAEQIEWRDRHPMAEAVAQLGIQRVLAGQTDDVYQLSPKYHRVSAAEENYDEQQRRRSEK